MKRRQLGQGGPVVSAVGVGGLSFSAFYGPTTEAESHAVLAAALELGIDHVDTANVYGVGLSERAIGGFLAERSGAAPFTIATKAGIRRDPETGARGFDNSRAHLQAELDASLGRLGVETIDLYYVHRRDPRVEIEEVADTLAGFIRAGKIRSYGLSEIAPSTLRRAAAVHPVAAVQSEYSLSTRAVELGLVQACAELGTALVAFSPVGRGLLTDRPPTSGTIAESEFLKVNPRFLEPNLSANVRLSNGFRALAREMGMPTAALAVAWLLHRGEHVLAIPGTRSVDHLRELAAGGSLELGPDALAAIERILPVGWAHGDRYTAGQWIGPERYG